MTIELKKKTGESSASTGNVKLYIKSDGSGYKVVTIDESGTERDLIRDDIDESKISHINISDVGTNTHAQIDTHIANTSNPHSVTKTLVGLSNVQNIKVNLSASTDPTTTDDTSAGYAPGSIWVNTTGDSAWVCVDATASAAIWTDFTAAGSVEFTDSTFRVKDNVDATKKVALEVSGLTTATTRTLTVPDESGVLAYRNTDNQFSVAQSFASQAYSVTNTLTDAATIATDCNNGNVHTVTLAGNRTLGAPSNLKNGATYIWIIKQDATGTRTLAYNAVFKFPGGVAPTLTTTGNAVDILSGISDGVNVYCDMTLDFG